MQYGDCGCRVLFRSDKSKLQRERVTDRQTEIQQDIQKQKKDSKVCVGGMQREQSYYTRGVSSDSQHTDNPSGYSYF